MHNFLQLVVSLSLFSIAGTAARLADASTPPTFQKIVLTNDFFCEGATAGDIDGDGHADIVGGPHWYPGPDFLASERRAYREGDALDINSYSNNFFTFTHDFNRDQRTDILVVGIPGEPAYWYENPGPSDRHWPQHLAFPVVDNESPALVPTADGSGVRLLCQTAGQFGWLDVPRRPAAGPWPFQPVSPNLGYGRFTHGLGQGDIDGDGHIDLLEKNGWWRNPGSDAPPSETWAFHPILFSEAGGAQMHAADLDGDGDQDVVTSKVAHGYGLSWFENTPGPAGPQFTERVIMGENSAENRWDVYFSQLHAVAVVDVNNDGRPDIVTGKRFWAHNGNDPGANEPAVLYWFENTPAAGGIEFRPHLIDRNSGVGTQVTVADLNGDNRIDIVVGNKKGIFAFLQHAAE